MTNEFKFDVFLCYNIKDRLVVEEIAYWLQEKNIRVWFDKLKLRPGEPWAKGLEEGIKNSAAVVIFISINGIGQWQQLEWWAILNEKINSGCPIIPVLLPGNYETSTLSSFMKAYELVDFRNGLDDKSARAKLLWGITGRNPKNHTDNGKEKIRNDYNHSNLLKLLLAKEKETESHRLQALLDQESLLMEKLVYLRKCYIIETAGEHKFKLKKQIEQLEEELKIITKEKCFAIQKIENLDQ